MSYPINKTNGDLLTTILDGTTNTDTGLTLIGRNYTGYGEAQNENFVKLLENFANSKPPGQSTGFAPIAGTLWWDTSNQRLKIYNGTEFVSVSPIVDSATAPVATNAGDLWWDTHNQQLRAWNGTTWLLIGPAYTATQGLTGPIVETFYDNGQTPHTVVVEYVNGHAVSVFSYDNFILGATTYGFNFISSGINLPGNKVVEGNATVQGFSIMGDDATMNGQLILSWLHNGIPQPGAAVLPGTTNIYDIGSGTNRFRDIYLSGNVFLSGASVNYANNALTLQNTNAAGNVDVYVNTNTGISRAVYVNGSSGLLYVNADPIDRFGVATKGYVDVGVQAANAALTAGVALINANVSALQTQLNNDIASTLTQLNSDVALINQTDTSTAARLTSLQNQVNLDETNTATNFSQAFSSIETINSRLSSFSPINSPSLIGTPTAPTPDPSDNSTLLATTAYVRANAAVLANDYNLKIASLTSATAVNLANGLAAKANIDSPAFTGTPTVPTPAAGDNTTNIATTAFVGAAIAAQKFNYTVSANPPSGGNNGDFWFQVG